jgi:hypothetical protein
MPHEHRIMPGVGQTKLCSSPVIYDLRITFRGGGGADQSFEVRQRVTGYGSRFMPGVVLTKLSSLLWIVDYGLNFGVGVVPTKASRFNIGAAG